MAAGALKGPSARVEGLHLGLFFTLGVSLRQWDQMGTLERELALYRALKRHVRQIIFVTYGGLRDLGYGGKIAGIRVISNVLRLPSRIYAGTVSRLLAKAYGEGVIFRSNQLQGAEIPMETARRYGRKFIARCGYLYSDFTERRCGADSQEADRARTLEKKVFSSADRVVVTTPSMREEVMRRHSIPPGRIHVIPNYVDTDLFRPREAHTDTTRRVCFVGRLDRQKNLKALIEAMEGLDAELFVVGSGRLRGDLEEEAKRRGVCVRFLGNVPHRRLPEIHNSSSLFILPSHYEGHPKALLEAMACGRPCIGTDVPGTRELIRDGETGLLCGTSADQIRSAIRHLLDDRALRASLGARAREFVVEGFSLPKVLDLELRLLEGLVAEMRPR